MSTWYREVPNSAPVDQGELLFDFPILGVKPNCPVDEVLAGNEEAGLDALISLTDVVVVSQACDIENDKIEFLVLAQVWDAGQFIPREEERASPNEARGRRKQFFKDVRRGLRPNFVLLGRHAGDFDLGYQLVDLSRIYTSSVEFVEYYRTHARRPRLRLNTPHRELLNQSLGHYFSRIGLPNDDHITEDDLLECVLPPSL